MRIELPPQIEACRSRDLDRTPSAQLIMYVALGLERAKDLATLAATRFGRSRDGAARREEPPLK